MRRAPGWTRLAGIALELAALAFLGYVVMGREDERRPRFLGRPSMPQGDTDAAPRGDTDAAVQPEPRQSEPLFSEPMDFITESSDAGAHYYRAAGDGVELLAGFYSDGRLRLADSENRRFAGLLQSGHADLLELGSNQWSEVFLRTTPAGIIQLELRGGPYDARVLTCETLKS